MMMMMIQTKPIIMQTQIASQKTDKSMHQAPSTWQISANVKGKEKSNIASKTNIF